MLKQFGSFIGWFSGSLAGISAFLYALGFVATMAEDRLLGIGFAFATRDPEFYIERGGNLVLRTVIYAIWPVLGLVLLAAAIRWVADRSGLSQRPSLGPARRFAIGLAAPAVALAMLSVTLWALVTIVGPSLGVSELLFQSRSAEEVCNGSNELAKAIHGLDREALNGWFARLALHAGVVVGLGIVAHAALLAEGRSLWLCTAGVAGFLLLVALPLGYGVLAAEKSAPAATIEPPAGPESGRVRLLSRSEGGILVWLEDRPFVQWISAGRIEILTVGRGEPIKTISCPDADTQPKGD